MDPNRIISIGWLYGINRTIILTPRLDGSSFPTRVTISAESFEEIRHDRELMEAKAAELLSSNQPNHQDHA